MQEKVFELSEVGFVEAAGGGANRKDLMQKLIEYCEKMTFPAKSNFFKWKRKRFDSATLLWCPLVMGTPGYWKSVTW